MPPIPSIKLASFPSSRNRPRPATRFVTPNLGEFTLPASGTIGVPGAPVKLMDVNASRTYFNIENNAENMVGGVPYSPTNTLKFGYAPLGQEGAPPADLALNGFVLVPGSGIADEPSPQEIWAVNMCDNDKDAVVIGSVEEGVG
jgi:hypothetical protein